jgi:hypothetical protein
LHTLGVQNRRSINTAAKMKSLHSKDGTTCDHTEQQLQAALHVVGRRSHPAALNCMRAQQHAQYNQQWRSGLSTEHAEQLRSSNTQQHQQRRPCIARCSRA